MSDHNTPDGGDASALAFALAAISPVDGRYAAQTRALQAHFSESALIRHRIEVELLWLDAIVPLLAPPALFNDTVATALADIRAHSANNTDAVAARVKQLEASTKHDVKAVEYWIGEQLDARKLSALRPYTHFACTSWDINNVALAKQVMQALQQVMLPALDDIQAQLRARITATAAMPMLARTHGQPASPTTLGKELANFYMRIAPRRARLAQTRLPAKFSGATGNFNAHVIAAGHIDWQRVAADFIQGQNLRYATHTTQIEPYDDLADTLDLIRRINTIILDLCRDCWAYISMEYFMQDKGGAGEAGSSTMPHKINPIDFENAEGNIGIANAMLAHFADKLPVSRLQRDLSDSTVLRAIGAAMAHTLIAWTATAKGLAKLSVNEEKMAADLNSNWAVLTEAIQTVMRYEGAADAYEQLKALSRGERITADSLREFISGLSISDDAKERLLALMPGEYCGLAAKLAGDLD